jgi:protein-S-isoprenylcysteine O-methyltransferase Ste14
MIYMLIFCVISAGFVFYSWPSFRDRCRHGFPRFFLWEADLALILIQAKVWFAHPWAWNQLVSWMLLAASIGVVIAGFSMLKKMGKAQGHFENTTVLVVNGIYRYICHPMYSSLLFLGWGAYCKDLTLLSTILVLIATAGAIATAKLEEVELERKFGQAYREYRQHTARFLPYIW